MTTFAKVDVKDIKSEFQRSSFLEEQIEDLANSILKSGGILKPLILKQIDIESYKVLDGHLEYYAAVRAREKDPRQAEMVNAFIILPKDEPTAQNQINVLKGSSSKITETVTVTNKGSNSDWISSFEQRLTKIADELLSSKLQNENRFSKLEKIDNKISLLEFLNTSQKQVLIEQLPRYGVSNKRGIPEKIYEARLQKENKKFDSYQDIVKSTKNFGESGMLKLIDSWIVFNGSDR